MKLIDSNDLVDYLKKQIETWDKEQSKSPSMEIMGVCEGRVHALEDVIEWVGINYWIS